MAYTIQYISEEDQYQDVFRKMNENFRYLVTSGILSKTDLIKFLSGEEVELNFSSDFSNKVAGDLITNPNYASYQASATLIRPSSFVADSYIDYSKLSKLDGAVQSTSNTTNGNYSQLLISYNLVKLVTAVLGESIWFSLGLTDATKQSQFVQSKLTALTTTNYGYASASSSNQLQVNIAVNNSGVFSNYVTGGSTTNQYVTEIKSNVAELRVIDKVVANDGSFNVMLSTGSSNGIVSSNLRADYTSINFSLRLKASDFMYTKDTIDKHILDIVTGELLATFSEEFSIQTNSVSGSRYINNLLYENKLQNGDFSKGDTNISYTATNGHSAKINSSGNLEIYYDNTKASRGNIMFKPGSINFLLTDYDEAIPVYAYVRMRSISGAPTIHAELYGGNSLDIRDISITSNWDTYKFTLQKRKLGTFYLWVASNASASFEVDWIVLTTKEMDSPVYYPAPEDFGVVHGQPNLLTGTSNEWEEFTFSSWDEGKNYQVMMDDVGLRVGDTVTLSVEIANKSGVDDGVSKLFVNKGSVNLLKKSGNPISAGSTGVSGLSVTIPEGADRLFWYKVAKGGNTTESTLAVRKHKLIKGSLDAMDEWTPHQSDSGLTIKNDGMVPFTDVDYLNLRTPEKTVDASNKIVGNGAEIQFDFPVLDTLTLKYPYIFKDLTAEEKRAKFFELVTDVELFHTSVGTGIKTTGQTIDYFSKPYVKTLGETWSGLSNAHNATKDFNEVRKVLESTAVYYLSNEGKYSITLTTRKNGTTDNGCITDGVTPATLKVKDIKMRVKFQYSGKTIVEDILADFDGFTNYDTKKEVSTKIVETIGGNASANLDKELLIDSTEGTAQRYVKDLPYENKVPNSDLSRDVVNYSSVNGAYTSKTTKGDYGLNYASVNSTSGGNTTSKGICFKGSISDFPSVVDKEGTAGITVWSTDSASVGKTFSIAIVWYDNWRFVKMTNFTMPSTPTNFEIPFSIASNTVNSGGTPKLGICVFDGQKDTPLKYNATLAYITDKVGTYNQSYPAPEDYGVVHGQPNLLNGTSDEWETFSFSTWDVSFKQVTLSSIGLAVGDKIAFRCEYDNTQSSVRSKFKIVYRDKDFKGIKETSPTIISTGAVGVSQGEDVVPEEAVYLYWAKAGKLDGTTQSTILARKHKLIKGSLAAMDEWTPSQSDSGLTIVNNGMVPFTDDEYATLNDPDGIVRAETKVVGRGAEIQFYFDVIGTLEKKYPYLFEGLTTIAEKNAKYLTTIKSISLHSNFRGYGTDSGVSSYFAKAFSKDPSTVTWTQISEVFNSSSSFKATDYSMIQNWFKRIDNEGKYSFKICSKANDSSVWGVVSDGVTPAWVEVKNIKLTVELEVNGRTIIDTVVASSVANATSSITNDIAQLKVADTQLSNFIGSLRTDLTTLKNNSVTLTTAQTITGQKNFSKRPLVESGSAVITTDAATSEEVVLGEDTSKYLTPANFKEANQHNRDRFIEYFTSGAKVDNIITEFTYLKIGSSTFANSIANRPYTINSDGSLTITRNIRAKTTANLQVNPAAVSSSSKAATALAFLYIRPVQTISGIDVNSYQIVAFGNTSPGSGWSGAGTLINDFVAGDIIRPTFKISSNSSATYAQLTSFTFEEILPDEQKILVNNLENNPVMRYNDVEAYFNSKYKMASKTLGMSDLSVTSNVTEFAALIKRVGNEVRFYGRINLKAAMSRTNILVIPTGFIPSETEFNEIWNIPISTSRTDDYSKGQIFSGGQVEQGTGIFSYSATKEGNTYFTGSWSTSDPFPVESTAGVTLSYGTSIQAEFETDPFIRESELDAKLNGTTKYVYKSDIISTYQSAFNDLIGYFHKVGKVVTFNARVDMATAKNNLIDFLPVPDGFKMSAQSTDIWFIPLAVHRNLNYATESIGAGGGIANNFVRFSNTLTGNYYIGATWITD